MTLSNETSAPLSAGLTGEEKLEIRRAQIREGVAKHKAKLSAMTDLEQAAWKARGTLGEGFQPYTPEELEAVGRIKALKAALELEVRVFNSILSERLARDVKETPKLAPLLDAVLSSKTNSIFLKPY